MKRAALVLVALFGLAVAVPPELVPDFESYIAHFGKTYDSAEYETRKIVFEARLETIKEHNARGEASHTLGINNMTDWTDLEFSSLLGFDWPMHNFRRAQSYQSRLPAPLRARQISPELLATGLNWAKLNATTPVKNQGGCGSCWTFAGTEAIESNIFLETGHLPVLAPQLYVDCVANTARCGGSGGCAGGTPDLLFDFAVDNGARLEASYNYTQKEGVCLAGRTENVASISGWVDVQDNDYTSLLLAVSRQPVAIGVAAGSWALYDGGVLKFDDCDAEINHAVLLVGYGTDPKLGDYWIVQNSWGPSWGEEGFIRLERNPADSTRCHEDTKPLDGFGCEGHDDPVSVCGTCGLLYGASYPVGGRLL